MSEQPEAVAKLSWQDPETGEDREYVLEEGATATLGRSPNNHICVPERHVSRQHAVITCRAGVFMLTDLGSANGTFVNEEPIAAQFPLTHGDTIRLYVPQIAFSAVVTDAEHAQARADGTAIGPGGAEGPAKLCITAGPEEGTEIPLLTPVLTIGRKTRSALWDVSLHDRAVSRPHAELHRDGDGWTIIDLGSANGTRVNGAPLSAYQPRPLSDGDVLTLGQTTLLFRGNT